MTQNTRHEQEVSYTYNTVPFAPGTPGAGTAKSMPTSAVAALSILEAEYDYPISGMFAGSITANATAFQYTENGTRPFITTLTDERLDFATSTGTHQLEPEDYRFLRVAITGYQERAPITIDGVVVDAQEVFGADRSPIRLEYRTPAAAEWQYLTTFTPTAAATSSWFNLPDEDVYQVRAVHTNGLYSVAFTLQFAIQLNATPRVLDLIEDQETVDLVNRGLLTVTDHDRNAIPSISSQESSARTRLTRVGFTSQIMKGTRSSVISDAANARMIIPYRVTIQTNTMGAGAARLPDDVFQQRVPEQTEGVFYDLLPRGTILDQNSVIARDVMGRTVSHTMEMVENWEGSGRTLVIIYVSATAGLNYNNVGSTTFLSTTTLGGTGFSVDFDVSYPWMNIRFFGNNLRNIVSYQSRSGELFMNPVGWNNPHTNGENTSIELSDQEQEWLSNFPNTEGVDPEARSTMSASVNNTISILTADQTGFRKMVRATGDTAYSMETRVRPGATYVYRLHYASPNEDEAMNLVIFDVLEAAHEERPHWLGRLESIDLTHPESLGIAPVVYYSTELDLDPLTNSEHEDLTNPIWTTTPPANRAEITAIAIDLSTDIDGEPFVFRPEGGTVVNLHMRAPHDHEAGSIAYNRALYRVTTISTTDEATINWPIASVPYTQVELLEREITISKTSDPETGTAEEPRQIPIGSTVDYEITIYNIGESILRNIVVEDEIPAYMSFDSDELMGFFEYYSDDPDDPPTAIPLSEHDRITYEVEGNLIQWTIETLEEGETFTLLVSATVDSDLATRTEFINTAYITSINGQDYNIPSETMYHVAIPDLTELEVIKQWEDDDDSLELRPESIQVQLQIVQAEGENRDVEGVEAVTLNEANNWSHIFTNLPAYDGDDRIIYTAIEVNVPAGYEVTYDDEEDGVVTIINTLEPSTPPTTEPSTVPTEPPTVPTEPPTAPTEPPTVPTEPPTDPTDPTPTEPPATDPPGTPGQPGAPGQPGTPVQPPRLPQTGTIVGLSILGGSAILASGLAMASKKKNRAEKE